MNDKSESFTNDSGTSAAIEYARTVTEPKVITVEFEGNNEQVLITTRADGATGRELVRDMFAAHASAPERRKGTVVVHDLGSFVAATNRDKRPDSIIFADVPARKVVAVLDFHGPADSAPRFGQDRIEYGFQFSPQFLAWLQSAREPMDQKKFSRLIDDRLGDIGEAVLEAGSIAAEFAKRRGIQFATVADLVAFTRTIAAKSTVESTEIVDENTGDVSIQYAKRGDVKTADGKPVPVPPAFVLRIPILNGIGATQYNIACRLRYDITEKGIAWRVELHAAEQYVLAAIEEALVIVRKAAPDGCGLPVYMATIP